MYDPDDPEERQDFRWSVMESHAPPENVKDLAAVIHLQRLLSIDKLIVTSAELRRRYSSHLGRIVGVNEFEAAFDELLGVEVSMLDDDVESDVFFIHQ